MASKKQQTRKSMAGKTKQVSDNYDKGFASSYLTLPDGVEYLPLEKGRMSLDIIPYEVTDPHHPEGIDVGDLWWRRKITIHKNIGPENKTVLCPGSVNKRCPICEEVARLRENWSENEDIIKQIMAKKRDIMNIRVVGENEVQILDISYHLFMKDILKEINEGDEVHNRFPDVEDGFTIKVRWQEKTFGKAKYFEIDRVDFEERDNYTNKILTQAVNLDEILDVPLYSAVETMFKQIDEEGSEPEEEPETTELEEAPEEEPESEPAAESLVGETVICKEDGIECVVRHHDVDTGAITITDPDNKDWEMTVDDIEVPEPEPEPEEESLVGKTVICKEDSIECEVIAHDPESGDVTIKDPDGESFDMTVDDIEVPEAEKEEEPPPTGRTKGGKNKCLSGHTFGKDSQKFPECKDCDNDLWDKCDDAKTEMGK